MDLGLDKYGSHYLSISARYFENEKSNETHIKFIGLIKMEESTVGEILMTFYFPIQILES